MLKQGIIRRTSRRNGSEQSALNCPVPGRQRDSSSLRSFHKNGQKRARAECEHEPPTKKQKSSHHHGGNNLNTQTQFNDLNYDCIGLIFSLLAEKDKYNFRKVCSKWEAVFKELWKIVDIKVDVRHEEPSSKYEKMTMTDFNKLLTIGAGHHLKSVTIYATVDETNSLIGQINAEDYLIIGEFDLYDFLKVIANVSTNIKFFEFCALYLVPHNAQYISLLSAAISQLISRNRKMRFYTMLINEPHAKFFKLKDLPESIEDVSINFLVDDAPTICDWISVANNLRSLSFNAPPLKRQQKKSTTEVSSEYMSAKDYTSQMMKCVTYNDAISIKVLQLKVPTNSTLIEDVKSIAVMESLEELYITFPGWDVSMIDDFLLALSSGRTNNLKKLKLSRCNFTSKGIHSILENLYLTHLDLDSCFPRGVDFRKKQTTIRSFKLQHPYMMEFYFRTFLQTFEQLRHIQLYHTRLANEDLHALCAACPLLEEVEIISLISTITDEAIHHMLTTLSKLTTVVFFIKNVVNFIPLHMDNVHSNVRDVRLYAVDEEKNLAQLAKLHNMRSLSLMGPYRYPTNLEIEAICSGCETLEEIHILQASAWRFMDLKVVEKRLDSLLQAKPSLQLVTIDLVPATYADRGEKVTLEKQHGKTVRTAKHYWSHYESKPPVWSFKHALE